MESMSRNLDLMAKEIRETFTDFMLNHSKIDPPRAYGDELIGFTPDGDRSYAYLDDAGRKLQSALLDSYQRFYTTFQPLLEEQSDDVTSKMSKLNRIIVRTIEHRLTWCETTKQALDRALAALEDQLNLVKSIDQEQSRKAK